MNKEIIEIKDSLLKNCKDDNKMYKYIETIGKDKKRPLGKFNISSWAIEFVRGCNISCGCCATRLFEKNKYDYMTIDTFDKFTKLINIVTPYNRIDIAQAGEPTLNPNLVELLKIGRKNSPHSFYELITNGTKLIDGTIKYKDLFENGANVVYTDMYAPIEKHIDLAKKSGYNYYYRGDKKTSINNKIKAWTYYSDTNIKLIILQDNPTNWNKRVVSSGRFSTFMNNLDWKAAEKFGLKPINNPPKRRCRQPFKMGVLSFDGYYTYCCYDFMRLKTGQLGNINDGIQGFCEYWFGKYMQETRKYLFYGDRKGHEYCSKCACTSSRGDIPAWDEDQFSYYLNNSKWFENKVKINKPVTYNILKD